MVLSMTIGEGDMKKLLLLLLCVPLMFSCENNLNKERVLINDLQMEYDTTIRKNTYQVHVFNGVYYYKGELFNGIGYAMHENGKLKGEANCTNKLLLLKSKETRGLFPHLKTIKYELLLKVRVDS